MIGGSAPELERFLGAHKKQVQKLKLERKGIEQADELIRQTSYDETDLIWEQLAQRAGSSSRHKAMLVHE